MFSLHATNKNLSNMQTRRNNKSHKADHNSNNNRRAVKFLKEEIRLHFAGKSNGDCSSGLHSTQPPVQST
jgi:hypothetical protein